MIRKLLATLLLTGCVATEKHEITVVGKDGKDGYNTIVDVSLVAPTCLNGGKTITLALDTNRDGVFDSGDTVQHSFEVCNGLNGSDGLVGPAGANGKSAYELAVDNGFIGTLQDWIASLQGPPGQNSGGGNVTPVKLCAADNATHPEYGFVVDGYIYAVYYGVVGGTLSAFWARLNPGNYVTTNDGSPCQFSVSYSNGNAYLDGVLVGGGNSNVLAGQCSLTSIDGHQYTFEISGLTQHNGYVLSIATVDAMVTGHNYSGGGANTVSGNPYQINPYAGSATNFTVYVNKQLGGYVSNATVTKDDKTMTCEVEN